MLNHELLRDEGILVVMPSGPFEAKDFERIAREVDPYIEDKGKLNGLMICAKSFPGWDDFAALITHFRFIKNHHHNIQKVAAVADSGFLSALPHIASHFIQAEVRHFDYGDREAALDWIRE